MPQDHQVQQLISHLFRHESGKMASVLTRLLGFSNLDTAEDIVQETLLQVMQTWKIKGIPENPTGWLYTVAKNKAIDVVRKGKRDKMHHEKLNELLTSEWTLSSTVNQLFLDNEIEDSQLRMVFACCHPAIPYESQIALTLKTLCGLSESEIAHGFLTNEDTVNKRIYRAREKIKEEKINLEVPIGNALIERTEIVLKTLYLLFNEGYNSSNPDRLIRKDLCEEAIRLCLVLTNVPKTNLPETLALLSMMCFHARLDEQNNIILLKDQDRKKWNAPLSKKGLQYLEDASVGNKLTEYHLEAAIAACHSLAQNFNDTNWSRIQSLYQSLLKIKPGQIIEMNMAIALGYATTSQQGLNSLLSIQGLERNHFYQTALGDFYYANGNNIQASVCYRRALDITKSKFEQQVIRNKLLIIE